MPLAPKRYLVSVFSASQQLLTLSITDSIIARLSSWLDILGSVLNWLKAYISSCTFRFKRNDNFPLLRLLLIWLTSRFCSCSFIRHLVYHPSQYTCFVSLIKPPSLCWNHSHDFDSNMAQLHNALQHIFSWMTANLLTLNFPKTHALLIGLKQQLLK